MLLKSLTKETLLKSTPHTKRADFYCETFDSSIVFFSVHSLFFPFNFYEDCVCFIRALCSHTLTRTSSEHTSCYICMYFCVVFFFTISSIFVSNQKQKLKKKKLVLTTLKYSSGEHAHTPARTPRHMIETYIYIYYERILYLSPLDLFWAQFIYMNRFDWIERASERTSVHSVYSSDWAVVFF